MSDDLIPALRRMASVAPNTDRERELTAAADGLERLGSENAGRGSRATARGVRSGLSGSDAYRGLPPTTRGGTRLSGA